MANPYLADLHQRLEQKFGAQAASLSTSDWIKKFTTLKEKPFSFSRYPFQEAIANDFHRDMCCTKCSQVGLALDLNTPILTTKGWKTMGTLHLGDMIYAPDGGETEVTYLSPIYTDHVCYEIEFDSGEKIVADENHRWYVESHRVFNQHGFHKGKGRPSLKDNIAHSGILNTKTISLNFKRDNRNMFLIPNTKPLTMNSTDLPIDPYVLGAWLGDGSNATANLTSTHEDALEYKTTFIQKGYDLKIGNEITHKITALGEVKRHRTTKYDGTIATIHARLNHIDVLKNKHIPQSYLHASPADRLELIRGLMDTDGSITERGRCSFYNTNPQLVSGMEQLLNSLGIKTRTRWRKPAKGKLKCGHEINGNMDIAEVSFVVYEDQNPFYLSRKRSRVPVSGRKKEVQNHRIINVTEVAPRPVRCLTVDHSSHLFLAGRSLIQTHNTEIQIRKWLSFLTRNTGVNSIYTMPSEKMYKQVSSSRMRPIVDHDDVFNPPGSSSWTRKMELYQIGQSFGYVTGNTEGEATSIPADLLIHDELDLSDQAMIQLFQSRLQNSDYHLTHKFSTPTFIGYGIDAAYKVSDQMHYMCRCSGCNHWNIPDFTPNFVRIDGLSSDINDLSEIDQEMIDTQLDLYSSDTYVACEKCNRPLDLISPDREWVPAFPGRTSRGYEVGPFATNRRPIHQIVEALVKMKQENLRGWYNTILGKAFNDSNARLTEDDIRKIMDGNSYSHDDRIPVIVGIDVGLVCHIVIQVPSIPRITFKWMTVLADDLLDEVEKLDAQFNIIGGGIDRYPYTPLSNNVREVTNGRILPVEYKGKSPINLKTDEFDNPDYLQVNRTTAIDKVASAIRNKTSRFVNYGSAESTIITHLGDMIRVDRDEEDAVWNKLTGEDHYFHALIFADVATRYHEVMTLMNTGAGDMFGLTVANMATTSSNLHHMKR